MTKPGSADARPQWCVVLCCLALAGLLVPSSSAARAQIVMRVGHFPNVTHAQGLVAHAFSRQGKGWFEQRLGPEVTIQWFVYNAGPSAMEAIFAKSIDLTYVGPNPAINAYAKSRGEEVRVIAGAANGGSALVVQGDSTQMGGDAQVVPTANPDQLLLFKQKQLDGVWTVEPWVSLLESEAGGKVLVEEPKAIITLLVARREFLDTRRDIVRKFAAAHDELTEWIVKNPEEAQQLVRDELAVETRANVSAELIARAWKRIVPTHEISHDAMAKLVASAQAVGFLRDAPGLARLIEKP
jgi:NitT/TauT family transport system substrate-binding protein